MSGRIATGNLVKCAVRRHVDDLKNAGERGFYFDEKIAQEAVDFFPDLCRHSKGEWAGRPMTLEPWQKFIVAMIFGWRRKADGMRRFLDAFIEIARKNGKSTLCASLGLLLLTCDFPVEQGAEVYATATKKDQAKIIFNESRRMVQQSPDLREYCKVHVNSISLDLTNSFYQPLGSDSDGTDGLNPHAVIMDEIHAWQERHREFYEKLTSGGGSRRQPLSISITTAGNDKSEIWKERHGYAERVALSVESGAVMDDRFFAFVACIDKDDDPFDESNWIKANPNLGVSVSADYLRNQATRAKNDPTQLNSFKRYHMNVMVSSSEKAIEADLWAACGGELSNLINRECYAGVDIGTRDDFASVSLVFPFDEEGEKRWEVLSWSFIHAESKRDLTLFPFSKWIDEGSLIVTPGKSTDIATIQAKILELAKIYEIRSVAFDPNNARQLSQELENEGLPVFPFQQSAKKYNEPLTSYLNAIAEKTLRHDGDGLLAWQASNLVVKSNSQKQWMPDKSSSDEKIDAQVATIMAFSECLFHDAKETHRSPYELGEVVDLT